MISRDQLLAISLEVNVAAFLRAIRLGEGTADEAGYSRLVGGGSFTGWNDHPRILVRLKPGLSSTAAGAYQILARTWDGLVRQYSFIDFSPPTQDAAAVALIVGRQALEDVRAGRLADAVRKCNREWASLPGSPYGQRTESYTRVQAEYLAHGGALEVADAPVPIVERGREADAADIAATIAERAQPESQPATTITDTLFGLGRIVLGVAMPQASLAASIAEAAIPALIRIAPDLTKIFTDKAKPVSERNTEAALKVLEVAQAVTGARNAQEAVETLQDDSAAQADFQKAVQTEWYTLAESGGGGIEGARKFSTELASSGVPFYKLASFWITLILMPLVYLVVYAVVIRGGDGWSQEVKAMVVSAIISGILGAVTGFWLGSSISSDRKTDLLARR